MLKARNSIFLFLFVILIGSSCKKEEGISPRTGNLLIKITGIRTDYKSYKLYTEESYQASKLNIYQLPLKEGGAGKEKIEIKGLNQGNYILYVDLGDSWEIKASVQVTAKKVNEYSF
jgi:hypothetical protein